MSAARGLSSLGHMLEQTGRSDWTWRNSGKCHVPSCSKTHVPCSLVYRTMIPLHSNCVVHPITGRVRGYTAELYTAVKNGKNRTEPRQDLRTEPNRTRKREKQHRPDRDRCQIGDERQREISRAAGEAAGLGSPLFDVSDIHYTYQW